MPAPSYGHDELMVMVDVETTGLDHDTDMLLEIGLGIVRVEDMTMLSTWDTTLCPNPSWKGVAKGTWTSFAKEHCSQYVLDMHTKNGLWDDLDEGDFSTYAEAECDAINWLASWFPNMEDVGPMVGSNVANFDRLFIYHHLPLLNGRFHYRNIDFSTVKELCRRFNPPIFGKLPKKVERHRVISDLYETLDEGKFYVDNFLWV